MPQRDPAGSTRIGYETPNALGALWQSRPRLAAACVQRTSYAKAVQTYLRAVDFYCEQNGVSPGRVRVNTEVRDGRIIQRIVG